MHGKRLVEATLAGLGRLGVRRAVVRGNTLILAYHNVVADAARPDGDLPLHIRFSSFCDHLDVLQELCHVVPLQDLAAPAGSRPRAIITFDDAYRGAVINALPELARRGLPSTMFVPPAYLGGRTFWWDDAARAIGGGLPPDLRERALEAWRGREDDVRRGIPGMAEAAARAEHALQCCTLEELRSAVRAGPVSVGSHTWTHPNLTRLAAPELADELRRSLAWLREQFPAALIPFLTYPYGLVSGEVRGAAITAGYRGAMLVMGGWTGAEFDQFAIPRKNVPAGLSANGLALRLTGLLRP